jgi:hypothetical protein
MREVTRTIHNRSDSLVNAKLGITLSDDSVWAEGRVFLFTFLQLHLIMVLLGMKSYLKVPVFMFKLTLYRYDTVCY